MKLHIVLETFVLNKQIYVFVFFYIKNCISYKNTIKKIIFYFISFYIYYVNIIVFLCFTYLKNIAKAYAKRKEESSKPKRVFALSPSIRNKFNYY